MRVVIGGAVARVLVVIEVGLVFEALEQALAQRLRE